MDAYSFFETEKNYENDGVYIDYGKLGFRVKIARSGGKNTLWEKEFSKIMDKHKGKDLDLADQKDLEDDLLKVFIKAVIRTWEVCETVKDKVVWKEGVVVKNPDGSKVTSPPTFDNIRKVLKDLPQLYRDLSDKANDWQTFKRGEEDKQIKN